MEHRLSGGGVEQTGLMQAVIRGVERQLSNGGVAVGFVQVYSNRVSLKALVAQLVD